MEPQLNTYIIPTDKTISEIHRILLAVDNNTFNFEFALDRTRLAINNYTEFQGIMTIIDQIAREAMPDQDVRNAFMMSWTQLVLQIHYYINFANIQLPIHRFAFQKNDMCIIAEG